MIQLNITRRGDVEIRREDGSVFSVAAKRTKSKSSFDVEGVCSGRWPARGIYSASGNKYSYFFPKNVSFPTFLPIFCFSGYPKRIKLPLPQGNGQRSVRRQQEYASRMTGRMEFRTLYARMPVGGPGQLSPGPRIMDSPRAPGEGGLVWSGNVVSPPPPAWA